METFLVTERADMEARGWAELDFVLISGDAYVDHPSFARSVTKNVSINITFLYM